MGGGWEHVLTYFLKIIKFRLIFYFLFVILKYFCLLILFCFLKKCIITVEDVKTQKGYKKNQKPPKIPQLRNNTVDLVLCFLQTFKRARTHTHNVYFITSKKNEIEWLRILFIIHLILKQDHFISLQFFENIIFDDCKIYHWKDEKYFFPNTKCQVFSCYFWL